MKRRIINNLKIFLYLYALFFTFYFSISSMAKYASTVSNSGSASVAKWDVSASGLNNQSLPTIIIGDTTTYQDYTLTVTSNSEIALDYSIVIDHAPNDLEVQIDGGSTYTPTAGKITINNVGSFIAEDSTNTHTHTLTFIVPLGANTITNQDLDIDVVFTQAAF